MPDMLTTAKHVFWWGKLVRGGDLYRIVFEDVIHALLLAVGYPDLLQEQQLWRKFIDDLPEIERVSSEAFYVESGHQDVQS